MKKVEIHRALFLLAFFLLVSETTTGSEAVAWPIEHSTDTFTDTPTATTIRRGEGLNNRGDNVDLVIRCKGNEWDIYVKWKEFINTDYPQVTYRFDKKDARTRSWPISSDFQSTFHPWTREAIPNIASSNMLHVRVTPYGDNPITVSFDLSGSKATIDKMRQHCSGS